MNKNTEPLVNDRFAHPCSAACQGIPKRLAPHRFCNRPPQPLPPFSDALLCNNQVPYVITILINTLSRAIFDLTNRSPWNTH